MTWKDITTNQLVASRLMQAVKHGSISHAYIFEGDEHTPKEALAEHFIKSILCETKSGDACGTCSTCKKIEHGNYEDLYCIHGEGNSIKDEEIEEMQVRLKKKPVAGDRNIVIVHRADSMTLRAQNRLLKTLEEPFPGTIILLLCQNTDALAETILSRCVRYHLVEAETEASLIDRERAARIGTMMVSGERFYRIAAALNEVNEDRESAMLFLQTLESWFRDLLVAPFDKQGKLLKSSQDRDAYLQKSRLYRRERIYRGIALVEEAKKELSGNLNVSYTLKKLVLQLS